MQCVLVAISLCGANAAGPDTAFEFAGRLMATGPNTSQSVFPLPLPYRVEDCQLPWMLGWFIMINQKKQTGAGSTCPDPMSLLKAAPSPLDLMPPRVSALR